MILKRTLISLQTMISREMIRFFRIWVQTLLPSAISMGLYFIIFGNLIGPRIGMMEGYSYVQFIAPGLIMMAVITNAYSNVVASFYIARFDRHVEELLISPTPLLAILFSYTLGGLVRGMLIAVIVTGIALFFTHLSIYSFSVTFFTMVLSAILFSLAGFANAMTARNFDDISFVPTFVLTPLTYLGGVFYSIHLLPPFWQQVSKWNPILYMVNSFRYGMLGISDISIAFSMTMLCIACVLMFLLNWWMLEKGIGLRN